MKGFQLLFILFLFMTIFSFILIFIFSFGAAFIQRVSGFGFGIFIMTVLPYFLPTYGEATTLSGSLALITSAIIVSKMWHQILWKRLLPILITFLIVSFIAIQFVSSAADATLKHLLGFVLIIASLWFLFFSNNINVRPTLLVQICMGTLSGAMGGLFGMQGPPAVLYFLSCTNTKEQYIALTQSFFLIGNIVMTIFRTREGYFTQSVMIGWSCGIIAVLLGTWLGSKVFNKIPLNVLRYVIYLYMAVSGVIALLS